MIHIKREVQTRAISGFQSPAEDHSERRLDIIDRIVIDPDCTFYVQMTNNSMQNFGINKGSILVVDRSIKAIHNAIVLAFYNQAFYTRKYCKTGKEVWLIPGNEEYEIIKFKSGDECMVWGVVLVNINLQLPKELLKGKYTDVCSC